jgi:hypothetical protein
MTVYLILAVLALLAIVVSFVPKLEILHKVGSLLLSLDLVVYFLDKT